MFKNILKLSQYGNLTIFQTLALFLLLISSNFLDILGVVFFIPVIDSLNKTKSDVTLWIDDALLSTGLFSEINNYLIMMVAVFIIKAVLLFVIRLYTVNTASNIHYNIRKKLYESMIDSNINFIHSHKQGALLSGLNEHTVRSGHAFFTAINILIAVSLVMMYGVFIFFISFKLTLMTIVMSVVLYPLIKILGRQAYLHGKLYVNSLEEVQHFSLETFSSKKLLNAMQWKSYMLNSFDKKSKTLKESWKWNSFYSNSPTIIIQPYSMIILAGIMWGALELELSVGVLGAFALAFMRLLPSLQQSANFMTDLKASEPSILKVLKLLDKAQESKESFGDAKLSKIEKSISLNNIIFSYDDSHKILDKLSINIEAKKTTALVGPSGGGKTTVVDIILGLQKISKGDVFLDNISLDAVDLRILRKNISYVSQDAIFFNDSIYNNLLIGLDSKPSFEKIQQLCIDVGAWEFISEKEDGLDETIGDRGVKLSGGQKQKLNLVRAILREPTLLILDEATSALDHESENDIKNVMLKLNHKMTIIVIAHRFETIKHADKIFLIKDKKAKDLGNWESAKTILNNEKQILN
jgi:ABC-type multidrug transport system fused ATPase/permease subunit